MPHRRDRFDPTAPITDRAHGLKRPLLPGESAGTAPGVNIGPGDDDDGWTVPPPVTLSDGTVVQLHKDGEAWAAAFETMRAATRRIWVELYTFASDDTGRAVADLLCRRAREGLEVFVLYDSFGSSGSDRAMFDAIAAAGGHVRQFNPIRPWECAFGWRPLNRDHRKLVLVDDDRAGVGGMNLAGEYAGSWIVKAKLAGPLAQVPDAWRDNGVAIRGPLVRTLQESFARTWAYVAHGGPIRRVELIHHLAGGEFAVLASAPTPNSPMAADLCRLFAEATRSIDLTMAYFAPADALIDELCKAAGRGVRVRLMLPGRGDVALLVIAARSFYAKLMAHGVEVYERQNVVLHAKTIVVDAHTSIVGSTNLDYRSIEYNCELSVALRSDAFGRQMVDLFENDVRFSKRVDPDQWKSRPRYDRLVQWVVSRARYLL